jgi:hypothetical protein
MTTTTIEVPRERWNLFFDEFSRQHEAWIASFEILSPTIGAQTQGEDLPFAGITADFKDAENAVSVLLGTSPDDHVTHVVTAPKRVMLERIETPMGDEEVLEIESADETKMLLRFRSLELPKAVDEFC